VGGGVQLGPLGTAATNMPIVPATGDYDDGDFGGTIIDRGNWSSRRKPAPVPLCPTRTPHAARTPTRAAAVGSQRLTLRIYGFSDFVHRPDSKEFEVKNTTFRKLDLLRIALAKGPNRVGVSPHLRTETDPSGSGYGPAESSCEHGDEPSGSLKMLGS
jgi:hypothetical protein